MSDSIDKGIEWLHTEEGQRAIACDNTTAAAIFGYKAADAEWRGVVEMLVALLNEADELLDGEGVYAAPNCDLYKRIEEALTAIDNVMKGE